MKFKNISYAFKKSSVPFFNKVSLSIEDQKINFLIGKNGSGKTTLIDIILGFKKANIKPINSKKFLYLNQMLPVLDSIKVKDLAELILGIEYGMSSLTLEYIRTKVDGYTFDFLKENWDKYYSALSGGNQKIAQLILFLQVERELIVLDEPTAFLDRKNAASLFKVIKSHPERTYLIVTHDIRDFRYFDNFNVILLNDQKIQFEADKDGFIEHNQHNEFLQFFSQN